MSSLTLDEQSKADNTIHLAALSKGLSSKGQLKGSRDHDGFVNVGFSDPNLNQVLPCLLNERVEELKVPTCGDDSNTKGSDSLFLRQGDGDLLGVVAVLVVFNLVVGHFNEGDEEKR